MSDLAKLARKEKKEKVSGLDITIMPLGISDMDIIEDMEDKTKVMESVKKLIKVSIPNSTDSEVDNMSIEYIEELQSAIMRSNNISQDKIERAKENFLAEIKKDQDAKSA